MDEYLTEEVYCFDTFDDAVKYMERMRAERACDLSFDVDNTNAGRVKLTVKVGEAR